MKFDTFFKIVLGFIATVFLMVIVGYIGLFVLAVNLYHHFVH